MSIWIYRHEELIFDIKESAKINLLSSIDWAMYGYALGNSEIGVYNGSLKKWGIKLGSRISALCGTDFAIDGEKMLVTGSANGLLEVRDTKGELID